MLWVHQLTKKKLCASILLLLFGVVGCLKEKFVGKFCQKLSCLQYELLGMVLSIDILSNFASPALYLKSHPLYVSSQSCD